MYRVTTPTHTFTLPSDTSNYSEIQVAYKQGQNLLVKHYQDATLPEGMTLDGQNVIITLSQEETKSFSKGSASVQVRVLTSGGEAMASQVFTISVRDVITEDVLA